MRGASSAYTEAGPPERMSACGRRARTCCAVIVCGTSSEYTRASRTRRAINCAYCPPRSTTSTGRSSGGRSGIGRISAPVIRRLLRDRDVVRVRLTEAGGGDPHELGPFHVLDRRGAAVAHRLPQPTDQLVEDRLQRPFVGDSPLDSLGDELLDVLDVPLEVPVLREPPRTHCTERAHAAVLLEPLALLQYALARALVGSREQGAGHDRVRARCDRLRDVPGGSHPAVGDQRDVMARSNPRALVDRRDLR